MKPFKPPARSLNLNALAERWARSVKEECLSKLILYGEVTLRRALDCHVRRFHAERNHQRRSKAPVFPDEPPGAPDGTVRCE